jgi:hypothetical protein
MNMAHAPCYSRWPALLWTFVFVSVNLIACNMSNLPRNMNLKAFDPHRADFTCKYEADENPPITKEADALFLQGMAATSYELIFPETNATMPRRRCSGSRLLTWGTGKQR